MYELKIFNKNKEAKIPILDEKGNIVNINKNDIIIFKCNNCGEEAAKKAYSFRNGGYSYSPTFDYKSVNFLCKKCQTKKLI